MEHEGDSDTNCNSSGTQRLGKEPKSFGNRKTNRDHQNYSIVKIGQNIEKSPGDWWRLVVSKSPVKDHLFTQV